MGITHVMLLCLAAAPALGRPPGDLSPVPGMSTEEVEATLQLYADHLNKLCPGDTAPLVCSCQIGFRDQIRPSR